MLKASLGFMFSHGFRARSQPGHHIAIIDFVRSRIDKKHAGLLIVFDRLRRKRNMALYDDTGFVSHHDAEQALALYKYFCEQTERVVEYLAVARKLSNLINVPIPNLKHVSKNIHFSSRG